MIAIETPRLLLRPCRESDRDLFCDLSSHPAVLEFFPFRRSRKNAEAVFDLIRAAMSQAGFELLALTLKETGEAIGFSGLSKPDLAPILPGGTVEIGWRLSARNWRRGYATEAGVALLPHGFETLGLDEIVSLTVHNNQRAVAVIRRLGMHHDSHGDFDHPEIPESHPQLKRHLLFRLCASEWRSRQAKIC